ncbi:MAG: hypothetical protein ACTSQH_01875, partial [Candidatus Hodarchaeales archaeon]
QEAVKILHHLHAKSEIERLGSLQLNYVIYNGLTGKFYELEKPKNPKCEMCGPNRTPIYKIRAKKSFKLLQIIEKLSTEKNIPIDPEKNIPIDPEFPPTIFKIDNSNVTEIDPEQTIQEADLADYETVFITGFDDNSQIYLKFKLED